MSSRSLPLRWTRPAGVPSGWTAHLTTLQEFDDGNLLYASFRENRILDIRKLGGGTYELIAATFSKLPGEEYDNWVEAVLRVCVKAVASGNGGKNNPFRLCNWLRRGIPVFDENHIQGH